MNYNQLLAAFRAAVNNAELDQLAATCVELAEADMNRRLRTRQMLRTETATATEERVGLPDDFLAMGSVYVAGDPKSQLDFIDVDGFNGSRWRYDNAGRPTVYTIEGADIRLMPTPDADTAITLSFYARLEPLSDSVSTNWALAAAPDAYLYGALTQAGLFLDGDARVSNWAALYDAALTRLARSDLADSYGATLQMRPSAVI